MGGTASQNTRDSVLDGINRKDKHHITAGASYKIDENKALVLAAMFAPSSSVSGPNPLTPTQTIELERHQFEITVGWAWRI